MASLTAILSVFSLAFIGLSCACKVGWNSFGSKCYFISNDMETWPGAITMCHLFGAKLTEIHSQAEDMFLANLTMSKKGGFWIGMTDAPQEGTWMWLESNTPLSEGYSNWGPAQPDNSGHDQNCAFLNTHSNGQWFDGHCNNAKNYICVSDSGAGTQIVG